ncbi:HAD family hydrolase [Neobacillus notoginsengisoli]|uniref:HAD family hydrolase n=1 Tax=Neobacillus notoginsengisoli TaxID=1578198 RepID=A0A417YW64_9BACI|nr:HAD hydrolase-like protein [Neobacillus notoginsengisoli]RHW41647.1 HAD family hydrolase [Neobacillus notoginsengisoli]
MINTILFDVDGVLLSEEHYFDASALTVWEMLMSPNYLGLAPEKFRTDFTQAEIDAIRSEVFQKDGVLSFLKSRGLNANWDMIYITFSYHLIRLLSQLDDTSKIKNLFSNGLDRKTLMNIGNELKGRKNNLYFGKFLNDFEKSKETKRGLFRHLDALASEKLGIKTNVFQEKGELWSVGEHVSQEWYVGDDHVFNSTGRPSVQKGKAGFLANEKVLCPREDINRLFRDLEDCGILLGVGTGRPELETIQPFEQLGWLQYFDRDNIATADDVLMAERQRNDRQSLAKPHPYTYLQALFGKTTNADTLLNTPLPLKNGPETLVVGDSLADLLAARKMGCQFAAVLTGLTGTKARSQFEQHQADYIFENVMEVRSII